MADNKIEFSRMITKRTSQIGNVPTINTGSTIDNSWLSTDILIGEVFTNIQDDRIWVRTNNKMLEFGDADKQLISGTYDGVNTINFANSLGDAFSVTGLTSGGDDTFVSGMTFNDGTYDLTLNLNDGSNLISNLGILSSDVQVTGGTYNPSTGIVTFDNNDGGSFDVNGFTTGMTDTNYYTDSAYLVGDTLRFDRTDSTNAFSVDLSVFKDNTDTNYYTNNAYLSGNEIRFDRTDTSNAFSVDLTSILGGTDKFVTGGVYDESTSEVTFTMNDATTFVVTGIETSNLIPTIVTSSRSLVLTDKNKNLENDGDVTFTVPNNGDVPFEDGTQIFFTKISGSMSFTPAAGVTIRSVDSLLEIDRQYAGASLLYVGDDVWNLIGELK